MPPPRGKGRFSKDRKPKRNTQSLLFRRKRFCRFTVTGVKEIDYKDIDTLRDFIAENGAEDHAMQVILLEKVANLGNLGDVVKVRDRYARNFLIPTHAARRATESAIKDFENRRADLEKAANEKLTSAQALAEKMNGRTVHISQK